MAVSFDVCSSTSAVNPDLTIRQNGLHSLACLAQSGSFSGGRQLSQHAHGPQEVRLLIASCLLPGELGIPQRMGGKHGLFVSWRQFMVKLFQQLLLLGLRQHRQSRHDLPQHVGRLGRRSQPYFADVLRNGLKQRIRRALRLGLRNEFSLGRVLSRRLQLRGKRRVLRDHCGLCQARQRLSISLLACQLNGIAEHLGGRNRLVLA
jgi:hypothetical protein